MDGFLFNLEFSPPLKVYKYFGSFKSAKLPLYSFYKNTLFDIVKNPNKGI
mgnify:CR=1 FL=1